MRRKTNKKQRGEKEKEQRKTAKGKRIKGGGRRRKNTVLQPSCGCEPLPLANLHIVVHDNKDIPIGNTLDDFDFTPHGRAQEGWPSNATPSYTAPDHRRRKATAALRPHKRRKTL
jgi:hypothetical protein